jgi:hypothetical protein
MPQLLYSLIELAMKSKQKGSNIKAVALGHHEGNVIMGQKGMHLNDPSALISSRALLKLMHHQYDHCLMRPLNLANY